MSIYANPYFQFAAGSRKGKSKRSIEQSLERQHRRNARADRATQKARLDRVAVNAFGKPGAKPSVVLRRYSQKNNHI